jgi:hypothetical protein
MAKVIASKKSIEATFDGSYSSAWKAQTRDVIFHAREPESITRTQYNVASSDDVRYASWPGPIL